MTTAQANALADWIQSVLGARRLTAVYITHGHGDHWFGLGALTKRFPDVRILATPKVIAHMTAQTDPATSYQFWQSLFPGQINAGDVLRLVTALDASGVIDLEDHALVAHQVGHTDSADSTFLYVPDLALVVVGDIVYNDVHMYFGEATTREKRAEWIAAIEQIKGLRPETVVAGHKRPGAVDSTSNLAATVEYIRSWEELEQEAGSTEDLVRKVMERYPNRINPHIIWSGAVASFSAKD
jgi:glyoxylase-like metal-dependent hydrolase (beta-lactamase superfamily II)